MKIEVLESFLDGRDQYEKDDIRTVSDEDGEYFCSNGWARDVAGVVPTAPRSTSDVRLDVRSTSQEQSGGVK